MNNPGEAQLLAENAELREMIKTLQARIESLKEQNEQLAQHNHVLRLKVDAMGAQALWQEQREARSGAVADGIRCLAKRDAG